jgi:putative PIN family toxin of toxin-antitoxin system
VRVVLDTNVILSGLMYPDSIPGRIVMAWREGRFDIVTSVEQLAEIGRTLAYPKIRKVLGWDDGRIGQFLRQMFLRTEVVRLVDQAATGLRDPGDAPILQTLLQSGAEVLVSGDGDLLALAARYRIEPPAAFARRL